MWNLEVTSDKKILLTFESFDLESFYEDCSYYDYVKISFGSVEEKYCGSNLPSSIISSSNTMTVTFHSDGYSYSYSFGYATNSNGFKATWEAIEGDDLKGNRYICSNSITNSLFNSVSDFQQ